MATSPISASQQRAHFYNGLLLSISAFACTMTGMTARAQTAPPAPIRPMIDGNGVDLFNGTLSVQGPAMTIGNKSSGMSFNFWIDGVVWSDTTQAFLGLSGSTMTVAVGGMSDIFTVSGSTYTSAKGNGSALSFNSSSNVYTYTARDGTVAHFSSVLANAWNPYGTSGLITDMERPNGEKISYTWQGTSYCASWNENTGACQGYKDASRIANIISSNGFELVPIYSSYTFPTNYTQGVAVPMKWIRPAGENAYNLAISASTPVTTQTFTVVNSGSNTYDQITDMSGHIYQYGVSNGIINIQTPANSSQTVTIGYSTSNCAQATPCVSSVANGFGTTTYSWSNSGNVRTATVKDAQSHIATYTFAIPSGQMTSYTDPLGKQSSMQIDSYGRITQVTKPEGNYAQYSYDARGNVTRVTNVAKSGSGLSNIVTTSGYDSTCANAVKCNQPNWTQDALGNETDYTYDPTSGLVTSTTGPAAATGGIRPQTRITYSTMQAYYNTGGGSIVASGQNTYGVTATSVCRTEAGATVNGTQGVGPFTLSGSSTCAGTSDETKTTVSYGPQTAGTGNNLFPVSQTVAAGDGSLSATTSQTYDNIGNVSTAVGALGAGQTTYNFYDADRHLNGTIAPDPDGSGSRTPAAVEYTYNADEAMTTKSVGSVSNQATSLSSYAESYHTALTLDAYDRPIRTALVSGSTNYTVSDKRYDSLGRAYCAVQYMNMSNVPGSPASSCAAYQTTGPYGADRLVQSTFDADSRVLSTSDSVGVLKTVTYSANGNELTALDGQNNLTSYNYDGFDRLSQTNFPVTTQGGNASDANNYEVLTYDADSHVTNKRLRSGYNLVSTYDNLSRLATFMHSDNSSTVTHSYDLIDDLTQLSRSNGGVNNYTYDALGRLITEAQQFGTASYLYDAAGDRTRITWGDSFYAGYAYDMIGKVTSINENGATSGVGVLASYSYDNLGRRTSVAYGNGTGRSYAYDAVGRLAGLQLSFPSSSSYNELIGGVGGAGTPIAYNPASQIASITRSNDAYAWTAGYNVSRSYTTNGLNQFTNSGGTTLGYDSQGNLNLSGSTTYTYDALNRLSVLASGEEIGHDPANRISQFYFSPSNVTEFYYAGPELIAEYTSGPITNRYVPGPDTDEPIVWYQGSGTTSRNFLQADERGSIIAVSNSAGSVTNVNSYDEFGIPASANVGRYQYTGQLWSSDVGMYWYKARWYSPTLGRFMQTDPTGYGDGINWYNYVHSDPVNGKDTNGMDRSGIAMNWNGSSIAIHLQSQSQNNDPIDYNQMVSSSVSAVVDDSTVVVNDIANSLSSLGDISGFANLDNYAVTGTVSAGISISGSITTSGIIGSVGADIPGLSVSAMYFPSGASNALTGPSYTVGGDLSPLYNIATDGSIQGIGVGTSPTASPSYGANVFDAITKTVVDWNAAIQAKEEEDEEEWQEMTGGTG